MNYKKKKKKLNCCFILMNCSNLKQKIIFKTLLNFLFKFLEKIEKLGDMAIPMNLAAVDLPIKPPFNTDVKQSFNLAQILAKLNRHVGSFFLFDVSVNMDRNERETNRFTIGNTPTTTKSNR